MTSRTIERSSHATLADFMADLTPERLESYRQEIIARLGFDPKRDKRGIGIADATRLAGVKTGTGTQWRRRTKVGGIRQPFPTPRRGSPIGKPLYNPMQVAAWLDWTNRWPPGRAARPETWTTPDDADVA